MMTRTTTPALSLIISGMLTFLLAPQLRAGDLTIGLSLDTPPYVMDHASKGIEIEIVRAALEHKGYTFKPKQMSYRGLEDAVVRDKLDAAATVIEKRDGTFYSENYISFRNVAITRLSDAISIYTIADLPGKSIVAWEDAYEDLGREYRSLFSPEVKEPYRDKYREIEDQADQVELFWEQHAQVIVIDESIMTWYTKELGKEIDTSAELVYHRIFPETSEYRISFRDRQVRDDFNAGLKEIRKNGVYQKIYDKYLKQVSAP